jgi:hypothetical protein
MTLTPEQKRKVDESLERNLTILAGDARLIGLEEAVGILKLADNKMQALALLFKRIEELRRLKACMDFLDEPVYIEDDGNKDRDS